eukprot:338635-Pyramimonas_sp.AAC.1
MQSIPRCWLALLALVSTHRCCAMRSTLRSVPSNPPLPRITDVGDLFNWVEHSIEFAAWVTQTPFDALRQRIAGQIPSFVVSTSFSGIGAPEQAVHSIARYLGVTSTRPIWAIEYDQECRRELTLLKERPDCLFWDINDFWNPDLNVRAF